MYCTTIVVLLLTSLSCTSGLIVSLTKPNGDVDLISITNHVTLLEQTLTSFQTQFQATSIDLTTVKADLKTTRQEFLSLQSEHNDVVKDLAVTQSQLKDARADISTLKSDLRTAVSELGILKSQMVSPLALPTSPTPQNYVNVTILDVIGKDVKSNKAEIAALKWELQLVQTDLNETRAGVEMIVDHLNSTDTAANITEQLMCGCSERNHTWSEIDNLILSVLDLKSDLNMTSLELEKIEDRLNSSDFEVSHLKEHMMSTLNEMNNTRTEIDILQETVMGLETSLQGQNTSLNNVSLAVDHLATDVAFQASPSAYYFDVEDAEKLIYDTVFYNVGDGYNGTTGEFSAPVPGTYMFWAGTSTLGKNTRVRIRLRLNHDVQGYLAQGTAIAIDNSTESTATILTVAHLQEGDVVWLEKYSGTKRLFGSQESYIGGVLLRRH